MRVVEIGKHKVELRASPLALLFYQREFDRDLLADVAQLESLGSVTEEDLTGFDTVLMLQLAYAMNKAAKPDKITPRFEKWLDELGQGIFSDVTWLTEVAAEIADGFFRTEKPPSGDGK